MKINLYNITGKDTGKKIDLNKSIFGIDPNDHAIYLDVKQYMAGQRQGTSKAKERADINGSTRKIKRQKGTGTARMGSIKSPMLRGGGRAFGPRPRDYSFKLNKKVKQLARKSALSYKAKNEKIIALESFDFEQPKTKKINEIIKNLKITDKKLLLVVSEQNKNIYLSTRNLRDFKIVLASTITTYDVMRSSILLVTESSFDVLNDIFKN